MVTEAEKTRSDIEANSGFSKTSEKGTAPTNDKKSLTQETKRSTTDTANGSESKNNSVTEKPTAACIHQFNMHQKNNDDEAINKELKEAIGSDEKGYFEKLRSLQEYWNSESDSSTKRIISPLLVLYIEPINAAILSDNLDYFRKKYETHYKGRLDRALNIASLCGSKKVGEFLVERISIVKHKDLKDILPYVVASQNIEWAKEIATKMSKENQKMPDSVNMLSSSHSMAEEIRKIFEVGKFNPSSK